MSLLNDSNTNDSDHGVDIITIIAKTLYLGMVTNVIMPAALLFVCYYINENYTVSNKVGDMSNSLFFVFGILAVGQAVYAYWKKSNDIRKPMATNPEMFADQITIGIVKVFRKIFMIVASISLYGYLYFFLTGRFKDAMFMVLLSFIVFQFIRPRQSAIEKIIMHQKNLLNEITE